MKYEKPKCTVIEIETEQPLAGSCGQGHGHGHEDPNPEHGNDDEHGHGPGGPGHHGPWW